MQTLKGSNERKVAARRRRELYVKGQLSRRANVDVLPDDILLEVFNIYLEHRVVDAWYKLVHVCRRWRQVVFASPLRLNLRLLCTSRTPVKELLDIWPALPIVIVIDCGTLGTTNIDAALEHNDRVCEIPMVSSVSSLSMEEPFPALRSLELRSYGSNRSLVLPDSFLGGSAPSLRNLTLRGFSFPGLAKLLLSARHLVYLYLSYIPESGYISPEEIVTCLSSLTSLKELVLGFRSPISLLHQTNKHQPPLTRTALPSLTSLSFKGVSDYLEVIVARIDSPLLNRAHIIFLNQPISDTPLLRSFISRTEAFRAFHRANMLFSNTRIKVTLLREGRAHNGAPRLGISYRSSDRQLSSFARVCNSTLPPLPNLEHLSICDDQYRQHWYWRDDMGNTRWPELLHPFIAVKNLYLGKKFAPRVAPTLQEFARAGERATEVLPALQNIFVQGRVQQGIAQFTAARQLLGHPVAVQDWDGKF